MKTLAIVGTAAMFLVGGGILVHSIPAIHHVVQDMVEWLSHQIGAVAQMLGPILLEGLTGVIAGALVLLVVTAISKLIKSRTAQN